MLDHEKLDVYQCSLQLAVLAQRLTESMPRGQSELAEQLRRATFSIPLNIAEGTGKPSHKDRARFYAIARGSAMECGAVLDLLRVQKLAEAPIVDEGKSLLVRLVSMLSRMCR